MARKNIEDYRVVSSLHDDLHYIFKTLGERVIDKDNLLDAAYIFIGIVAVAAAPESGGGSVIAFGAWASKLKYGKQILILPDKTAKYRTILTYTSAGYTIAQNSAKIVFRFTGNRSWNEFVPPSLINIPVKVVAELTDNDGCVAVKTIEVVFQIVEGVLTMNFLTPQDYTKFKAVSDVLSVAGIVSGSIIKEDE